MRSCLDTKQGVRMKFPFQSIRARLLASVLFTAILVIVGLGFTLSGVRSVSDGFMHYLSDNQPRLDALNAMLREGLLGGMAARNKIFNPDLTLPSEVIARTAENFEQSLDVIRRGTPEEQQDVLARVNTIAQQWATVMLARQEVLRLVERGLAREAATVLADQENPAWREIRIELEELMALEQVRTEAARDLVA